MSIRWILQGVAWIRYLAYGLYYRIDREDVPLWAAAIAFKVLVTFVPVFIILTGIFALVLGQEEAFIALTGYLRTFLPDYQTDSIIRFLEAYQRTGRTLTLVGGIGLLISAMTLFSTLRGVVTNIFRYCHKPRAILHAHLFDLRMIMQTGLFFLLSFAMTLALRAINLAGQELMQEWGLTFVWLKTGWGLTFRLIGYFFPFFLSTFVFFQLYFFIPRPYPPAKSALLGATVGAMLWEILKNAFTYYVVNIADFDRYRQPAAGDPALRIIADFFVLILITVLWVYYSGLIFIIGGLIAHLHEVCVRRCPEVPLPLRKHCPSHPPDAHTLFSDQELSV